MKTYEQDAKEIIGRGLKERKNRTTVRVSAAASAVGILAVAAVLGILKDTSIATDAEKNASGNQIESYSIAAEVASIPHWEDAECAYRFPALPYNGLEYTITGTPIDVRYRGERIGKYELAGYDIYTDTNHAYIAEVYRITGIKSECAVAAELSNGKTYAYVNPGYTPQTLGQLISDLDLRNNAVFGMGYADNTDAQGHRHFLKYPDFDDTVLWNGLLSDTDLINDPAGAYGIQRISFSVSVPALGYENKGLWLTEDGYLVTNLLETAKTFYLGRDRVYAFMDQIKETLPHDEQVDVTFAPEEGSPE